MKAVRFVLLSACVLICLSGHALAFKNNTSCTKSNVDADCGGLEYACVNDLCAYCSTDSQCDGDFICDLSGSEPECRREHLFEKFTVGDIGASFVVLIGAALAAGGGLGGGGIFVPTFVLVAGLDIKEAVPLSVATIFGGSIVNMCFNVPAKHPTMPKRPLIDANAVLCLEPMLLAGTLIGVMLNVIFPAWLVVACLAVTLGYATVRTIRKGIRAWKAETVARKSELAQALEPDHATNPSNDEKEEEAVDDDVATPKLDDLSTPPHNSVTSVKSVNSPDDDLADAATVVQVAGTNATSNPLELAAILKHDEKPKVQAILVVVIWVVVSVFSMLKGGKAGAKSIIGVESCTGEYWGLTAANFFGLVLLTLVVSRWLASLHSRKTKFGYQYLDGEIVWSKRNTNLYPFLAAFAGILGGLLGIGGGMILGPLLLELGMKPRNVSATSATAVFLTASSAALQFLALDLLLLQRAAWYTSLGFLATIVGQTAVNKVVKKYQRTSIIVLSIASVLTIAVFMMVISGIIGIVADIDDGKSMGFKSMC